MPRLFPEPRTPGSLWCIVYFFRDSTHMPRHAKARHDLDMTMLFIWYQICLCRSFCIIIIFTGVFIIVVISIIIIIIIVIFQ